MKLRAISAEVLRRISTWIDPRKRIKAVADVDAVTAGLSELCLAAGLWGRMEDACAQMSVCVREATALPPAMRNKY